MGFLGDLKLKASMYSRLGAFARARKRGATQDEARAYAHELYPPTAEDLEFEVRVREKEEGRDRQ
jgi:hypothetical protein